MQLLDKGRLFARALGALMFTLFTVSVHAQIALDPNKGLDQYNFDHWTSQNGLPDNSIIHVIQAKNSYVWLASFGGVTRFDGVDFYTYNSYTTPEITNNSFTYIYEDSEGVIWGSSSGSGVAAFSNDKVTIYTAEHGLPSNFVEEVVEDKNDKLWIVTSKGLVYKSGDVFINDGVPEPLKSLSLKSADVDANNNLWVASVENGVYQLNPDGVLKHYNTANGLLSDKINFVKAGEGKVWIGTDKGLTIISGNEVQNITVEDGLLDNMVTAVHLDGNSDLWIGSFKGFTRYDGAKFHYVSDKHPIYHRDVTSIMEDSESNLWVSTYRGGLYTFWEGKFTNYSDYRFDGENLLTVHTVIEQAPDQYIFVMEDRIGRLDPTSNTLRPLDSSIDDIKTKYKIGLIDHSGVFWFGTNDGVIKYFNGKVSYFTTDDGLIDNHVRVIFEDAQHNIWIGTSFGISMISAEDGAVTNFDTQSGLSNEYIMNIYEDTKSNIWISTRNGLNVRTEEGFKNYYEKDGLAGDFVFKVFEDKDSVIWIGGNAGLTRYKNGHFTKVTTSNGLASGTIFQVLEDDYGYLWFTTNQRGMSLFKVLKKELNDFCEGKISQVNSIEYRQRDGIRSASATSSSRSLKSSDGKLWIATHSGVEVIDPGNIKINKRVPAVIVENFKLNDQVMKISEDIITIPSGKQRVTIKYTALSFLAIKDIQIKHRLEGFDEDWISSDQTREASYTNLPYGDYTFQVIAANSDGIWNEEGASISFVVKPAFYETTFFYVMIILIAVGLGPFIYFLRVRSLKRAQMELEKIVTERTQEVVLKKEEIESQNEEISSQRKFIEGQNQELKKINLNLEDIVGERTTELKKTYEELLEVHRDLDTFIYRSVHDVRGPIARLQGLSHIISLESSDKNILDLVNKLNNTAEEMNDVFYRLLNIVRLRTLNLEISEIDLKDQINKVLERFVHLKETKVNTTLEIEAGLKLNSDRAIFESILYQLIDNAIKFKKDDEHAKIHIACFTNEAGEVCIHVMDDGVGMDKSIAGNVFNFFYVGHDEIKGAGLGLYTAKTAAKALKGMINLKSTEGMNGYCTVFELVLPHL